MFQNVNKRMPSTSRPRNVAGGSGTSGRSATNTPMSERQQMALLMQMTSSSNQSEMSPGGPARSRDRNERGETAMHVAAIKGDQDGVKKLLDQGMSPNVADFAGWTPLHEACNHGHYNVALTLVKAGANVNARGLDDDTPLHDAAIVGQLKLVKMLVERGADPCFKNRKGKTPCDVAASAVYSFLTTARDAANNRAQQQMKKTTDVKKSMDDHDESNVASGSMATMQSCGPATKAQAKDEDDVYEFKTTPKDSSSSSGDDKSDGGKGSDKSSDEKSDDQGTKRSYSDIEGEGDDEVKRKKRKDGSDAGAAKEMNKSTSNRPPSQRQEKNSKFHGIAAKNSNLTNKNVATLDRKSPSASPKPAAAKTDSDVEMDDKNLTGEPFNAAGPKVPPLKIVIPQQSSSTDQEMGTRNGKSISTRNNAALPYVVASSSNSNDSADKESVSSRCTSPSDSTKSVDEKKLGTNLTNEDQKQQRVLRSSNRGGSSVDRSSNNSSPQLQSSSPSPAPVTQTSTTTTVSTTNTTASVTTESNENTKPSTSSSTTTNPVATSANSPSNPNVNSETETTNVPSPSASSTSSTKESSQNTVDLHPRKRKIRDSKGYSSKEENKQVPNATSSSSSSSSSSTTQTNTNNNDQNENATSNEVPHPHDQPITNCYQMYLNIRKQIERRQRNLFPVQPKPPQGFKDYLLNRRSYVLAGKSALDPTITFPSNLSSQLKDLFTQQEKDRHKLKMQHVVEKEKLVLSVEQEILRVHGRAARALANQSLPFSACTILKDEEVYNIITPEQEEKDRNARSRYNGRLFLSWLQDVDDKWEKIKEAMVLRHHNEAESLHAVQKMEWEWKMKELMLCEYKAQPIIEENYVPMVHVSDDFDLLP